MDELEKLKEENKKISETLKEINKVLLNEEPEEAIEKSKRLILLANL